MLASSQIWIYFYLDWCQQERRGCYCRYHGKNIIQKNSRKFFSFCWSFFCKDGPEMLIYLYCVYVIERTHFLFFFSCIYLINPKIFLYFNVYFILLTNRFNRFKIYYMIHLKKNNDKGFLIPLSSQPDGKNLWYNLGYLNWDFLNGGYRD